MIFNNVLSNLNETLTNKINYKLIQYLDKCVSNDMIIVEKALVIYLALGDVLRYSTIFTLYYNYDAVSRVKDINMENNLIICKNWAILYHRCLKHYGISSKVIRNGNHYSVQFINEGAIYSADVTNYGGNRVYYGMSDLAKIKYGFKVERFHVVGTVNPYDCELLCNKYNELNKIIDDVYQKQDRKYISRMKLSRIKSKLSYFIEKTSNAVGEGTNEDISNRIRIINKFWNLNIKDYGVEKVQLFKSFFNTMFEESSELNASCYCVYSLMDDIVKTYILIVITNFEDEVLYYLDNGHKFIIYDVESLLIEFRNRKIVLKDYTTILGLEDEIDEFKLSKKK